MRYFKRSWSETRGDEYDAWGTSVWYLEVDADLNVTRQLLVYANGITLKYDEDLPDDEYGGLSDQPVDPRDYARFEIQADEFEAAWGRARPVNGA
jgi:hypothetical protein